MQIYIGYINVHTHLAILRSVPFPLKLSFKLPVKESLSKRKVPENVSKKHYILTKVPNTNYSSMITVVTHPYLQFMRT